LLKAVFAAVPNVILAVGLAAVTHAPAVGITMVAMALRLVSDRRGRISGARAVFRLPLGRSRESGNVVELGYGGASGIVCLLLDTRQQALNAAEFVLPDDAVELRPHRLGEV